MSTAAFEINLPEIVAKWKDREGNLIMVLHQIQQKLGYVPRSLALEISKLLGEPLARIYEVLTFYHFFKLEKPGKHVALVCTGTACYLKGANKILKTFWDKLSVTPGQTTPDKEFHLEEVRCLGCCNLSPVVTLDNKIHAKMDEEKTVALIRQAKG